VIDGCISDSWFRRRNYRINLVSRLSAFAGGNPWFRLVNGVTGKCLGLLARPRGLDRKPGRGASGGVESATIMSARFAFVCPPARA